MSKTDWIILSSEFHPLVELAVAVCNFLQRFPAFLLHIFAHVIAEASETSFVKFLASFMPSVTST